MKRVSVAGVDTAYLEAGDGGPVVVLLSCGLFGGGSLEGLFPPVAALWAPVIPLLAAGCRVIALDTLGQGHTACVAKPSLQAAIDHVRGFLDARGITAAHLVGHDEGGLIAVQLAFQAPERVASCVIVDSPSVAPSGDGVDSLVLKNPLQPPRSIHALRWVMERVSASPHHFTPELAEALRDLRPAGPAVAIGKAKADNFARFRDAGLPVPAMVVWGQQDTLSPPSSGRALFDIISARQPATQLHVLNQAGYFSYREQPGMFAGLVRGFVRALE